MSKNVRKDKRYGKQYEWILDVMFGTDYFENSSDAQKIRYIMHDYVRVQSYQFPQSAIPNHAKLIGDYLMGLPSFVDYEFRSFEQVELGKKWGLDLFGAQKKFDFCSEFPTMIGQRIMELCNYFNIRIPKWHVSLLQENKIINSQKFSNGELARKYFKHFIQLVDSDFCKSIREGRDKNYHCTGYFYIEIEKSLCNNRIVFYLK